MAEPSLFAGPAIRRLRRREDMTQAAMAQRLAISPSYLNLIERNRRPLSARILVALTEAFDFDPRALNFDEATGGVDGLRRRLADERFGDLDIDRDDIEEWLSAAPQGAIAFARLFDAMAQQGHTDADASSGVIGEVRAAIDRWSNHFGELDDAAEALADELRMSSADPMHAITERLRSRHQISLRILPADVLPDMLRRLDLHARQLQLSELLAPASRMFQCAVQIGLLEHRDILRSIARGPRFEDASARALFERHLQNYFAAALIMPYGRFLRACEATGYDIALLQRRFGASYEQVAHRLTTLQRVGQRGLPFFMARIDRAGQFSKLHVGASGTSLLDASPSCPLWIVHRAFSRPGEIVAETVSLDESGGGRGEWFTFARSVDGIGSIESRRARYAVILGVAAELASDLAQARDDRATGSRVNQIGLGCARCRRMDCLQRSLPPRGMAIAFDERQRKLAPFSGEAR
jgi:predicted transcriptional regulator/DNA-binding XRE family transcriptional regulator